MIIKELNVSLSGYNVSSWVSDWLNVSNSNSIIVSLLTNKDCRFYIQYSNDTNYTITDEQFQLVNADTSAEIAITPSYEFARWGVDSYSVPVDITLQGLRFDISILSNTTNSLHVPKVELSNMPVGVFGSIATVEETSEIQYTFSHGTSGLMLTKAYKTPFTDLKTYTNSATYELDTTDQIYKIKGGVMGDKGLLRGRSYRYQAGQGLVFKYTGIFSQSAKVAPNDKITKQLIGVGNLNLAGTDPLNFVGFGYFDNTLSYNPSSFGIVYINNGINVFVTINNFNNPKGRNLALNADWGTLNVFKTTIQYLGGGNLRFYMIDKNTSEYVLLHTLKLAGTLTIPNLSDPSLELLLYQNAENGVSDPIDPSLDFIGCASFCCSQEGIYKLPFDRFSSNNTKAILANVETVIISIRNDITFYGRRNNFSIEIDIVSVACESTKPVLFNIYRNKVLVGPVWVTPYVDYIPLSVDITATLGANGITIFSMSLGKSDNMQMDLSNLHFIIGEGDVVTVSALSTANSDVSCCIGYHIR